MFPFLSSTSWKTLLSCNLSFALSLFFSIASLSLVLRPADNVDVIVMHLVVPLFHVADLHAGGLMRACERVSSGIYPSHQVAAT